MNKTRLFLIATYGEFLQFGNDAGQVSLVDEEEGLSVPGVEHVCSA